MTLVHHARIALIFVALASIVATAPSGATTVPTIDQSISLKTVGGIHISPDGRWVVYEQQQTDWKENAYVTQLWLVDTTGSGKPLQLTRGKKSSTSPVWSPDGRWIAFLTERDLMASSDEKKEEKPDAAAGAEGKSPQKKEPTEGKPDARQIWVLPVSGGEAWQLSKHGAKPGDVEWSKDGRFIAYTAAVPESKAAKERKEKYSDFEVFEGDYEQNQLWTIDFAAAVKDQMPVAASQVTSDPRLNVGSYSWSPDSTLIAFDATPNPLLAFGGESDIYVVNAASDHRVTKVVGLPGPDSDPVFSPDGKDLLFSTALGQQYYYYVNSHLATVAVDRVMAHPAMTVADIADLSSAFDEDPNVLEWCPSGLYFRASQRTASHLFRLDPKSGRITRVTSPDNFIASGISLSKDCSTAAVSSGDAAHLTEIYVSPVDSFAPRKLTDMSAQVRDWTLGSEEVVTWKSRDGAEIEGILHKPEGFDPSKRYPLLVVIHGGPTGVSRPVVSATNRYYPIEIFLSKGALVLEPNYRGSAGYGEKFRSLNVRNLGVGDMWDVLSGIDSLVARGMVDETRLGSMGWSQGGYISAFLTTNTDRFKAISVGAGISDWTTYYANTDITPFTRQYLHATPWEDPEIYARTSPITNIRKAKTPTLIQHGSADRRVPVPNGYELYRGLRDAGVPAKMITYAGFGHPINKPKSNRALLQHNLDWFSHYIWGEPFPADSPLRGSGAGE
jgi:dipeptidyl aminopeptidase/acylaminoacyl peptidase